jgi:hypothetical protein
MTDNKFSQILANVIDNARLTMTEDGRVNEAELEAELQFEAAEQGLDDEATARLIEWAKDRLLY